MPYKDPEQAKLARKKYAHTEKGRLARKKYNAKIRNSENSRQCRRNWFMTPKGKEARKRYDQSGRGKLCSKKSRLKYEYGITFEQYNQMLIDQDGKCAICFDKLQIGKFLHTDHNKITGKVRGLLCMKCNVLLGNCRDSVDILQSAIDYLSKEKV